MSKRFFETFPTLKIQKELRELLDLVEVLHINYTRDRSSILVYIRSPRLIQKECIYGLEEEMTKQLFGGQDLKTIIIEQYELSSQYTPKTLLEVYKESILLEFKRISDLEYHLLRKAEWEVIGETMLKITLEDSMWAHDRSLEIKRQLDKVFGERCGFSVDIQFAYVEMKTSRLRQEAEEREKKEIARVMSGIKSVRHTSEYIEAENNTDVPWNVDTVENTEKKLEGGPNKKEVRMEKEPGIREKKTVDAPNLSANGKGKAGKLNKKGSRGFQRKFVRSDNPNIIYGRDFDDISIKIEEIVEEMGEVTVRGKILDVMTRELRNGEKTIVSFPITDLTDTIMVKIFVPNENLSELLETLKKGSFVAERE